MDRAAGAPRALGVACALSGGMAGYILYLLLLPDAWHSPVAAAGLALLGGLAALPLARGRTSERQV